LNTRALAIGFSNEQTSVTIMHEKDLPAIGVRIFDELRGAHVELRKRELGIANDENAWLNDELIHFALWQIERQMTEGFDHCTISSLTFKSMERRFDANQSESSNSAAFESFSVFDKACISFPVHVKPNHWMLIIVRFELNKEAPKLGKMFVFDSMSNDKVRMEHTNKTRRCLSWLWELQMGCPTHRFTVANLPDVLVPVAQQRDGVSCGLHVIANFALAVDFFRRRQGEEIDDGDFFSQIALAKVSDSMCRDVRRCLAETLREIFERHSIHIM
jgi:hypothetical protein